MSALDQVNGHTWQISPGFFGIESSLIHESLAHRLFKGIIKGL